MHYPFHTSTGDSWTLTGNSGSVSCGVTAPFSWVLVRTRFCLCPPRVCSPVLWKFCNQIPLAFKVKFPGGSQSLCQIPRLGNLVWVPELSQQCKNFFGINCSPACGLSAGWFCGGAHTPHLPGLLQPELLFPWQATGDPCPTHQSKTQIPPQPVPPIRKLPQASYPHPPEGRQNGNHSHRKLTKPITRITAFSNSMKL